MNFSIKTLKTRLLVIISTSALILSATAIIATELLSEKIDTFQNILTVDSAQSVQMSKLNQMFKTQVQEWKNVLLRGHEQKDREKYWQRFIDSQEIIQKSSRSLNNASLPTGVKEALSNFTLSHENIFKSYEKAYQQFTNNGFDHKLADSIVRGIDREPSKQLGSAVEQMQKNIEEKTRALKATTLTYQITSTVIVLVVLILAISIGSYIVSKKIAHPVSRLIKQLSKVSSGDFSQAISVNGEDEIAQMGLAIEKLRIKMQSLVSELDTNKDGLNEVTSNISLSATKLQSKAEEQYQQAIDIDTASAQMSGATNMMEDSIGQASAIAIQAKESANLSQKVMSRTLQSIMSSSNEIESTAEVITQLGDDTTTVGSVVDVINSIAEQTNLLALNAAIEAARAGEQGRGFAVVADEVRTLASRTQQSTEEIKVIIEKLQDRAKGAINAISKGKQAVNESESSVNEASEVLCKVDDAVAEISSRNQQITNALKEQNQCGQVIQHRVTVLRESAQQTQSNANDLMQEKTSLERVRASIEQQVINIKA